MFSASPSSPPSAAPAVPVPASPPRAVACSWGPSRLESCSVLFVGPPQRGGAAFDPEAGRIGQDQRLLSCDSDGRASGPPGLLRGPRPGGPCGQSRALLFRGPGCGGAPPCRHQRSVLAPSRVSWGSRLSLGSRAFAGVSSQPSIVQRGWEPLDFTPRRARLPLPGPCAPTVPSPPQHPGTEGERASAPGARRATLLKTEQGSAGGSEDPHPVPVNSSERRFQIDYLECKTR